MQKPPETDGTDDLTHTVTCTPKIMRTYLLTCPAGRDFDEMTVQIDLRPVSHFIRQTGEIGTHAVMAPSAAKVVVSQNHQACAGRSVDKVSPPPRKAPSAAAHSRRPKSHCPAGRSAIAARPASSSARPVARPAGCTSSCAPIRQDRRPHSPLPKYSPCARSDTAHRQQNPSRFFAEKSPSPAAAPRLAWPPKAKGPP